MIARFHLDGVDLGLGKNEYNFIYLMLVYVLYGRGPADNHFYDLLGMSREDAEALLNALGEDERAARALGSHWNSSSSVERLE